VQSIAFSSDGGTLAVAAGPFFGNSGQTEVTLWDLAARRKRLLCRSDEIIHCVAFSGDGKTLATSGSPVRLWEAASGRLVRSLPDRFPAHFVAFSPDGKHIAAGAWWGARVWELPGLKEILDVPDACFCLAFSADGRDLATGGREGTISVWDIPRAARVAVLRGHTNWIWSLAFSSDARTLASGARDKTIRLWDLDRARGPDLLPAKSNQWQALRPHGIWRTPLAFSPAGSMALLAASAPSSGVRLFDVRTKQETRILQGPTSGVNALAFSPEGKWLAAASGGPAEPGELFLWEFADGRAAPALEQSAGVFSCVAFSSDGKTVAAGTGKTVRLWDVTTRKLQGVLEGHAADVASVAFSPDCTMLAAATLESRQYPDGVERKTPGEVKLWKLDTGEVHRTIQWSLRHGSVAFSPDGKLLAVAGWDEFRGAGGGMAGVWDVRSGERVAVIEGHNHGVLSVAFSPDGKLLATGSQYGAIKLTDTRTWQDRLTLRCDRCPIVDLAFSPDGEILAAGFDDQIQLWHAPEDQTPSKQ
jgi:WD40 repeat protein